MDPISVTVNLLSVASAVKELVQFAIRLKSSLEKIALNRQHLRSLADNIYESILALQNAADNVSEPCGLANEQLIDALAGLKRKFEHLLDRCDRLARQKESKFGVLGIGIKAWISSDRVQEEIQQLQNLVRDCQLHFTTFAVIRIENAHHHDTTEIKGKLDQILHQLHDHIRIAANDADSALVLSQLPRMCSNHSLRKARSAASITMQNYSPGDLESQYLHVRIKAIDDRLSSNMDFPKYAPLLARHANNLDQSIKETIEETHDTTLEAIQILRSLRQSTSMSSDEKASHLDKLATILHTTGSYHASCTASRLAVHIYHESESPNKPSRKLAAALNNLSFHLAASGRFDEALPAAQDAIGIYTSLIQQGQVHLRSHLGLCMSNVSNCLGRLNRNHEAVELAFKAVKVFEKSADYRFDELNSDHAMSLNNISIRLREVGKTKAAHKAARGAVEIYRVLIINLPETSSDFASALCSYSQCLRDMGSFTDALQAATEAVEIRRALASKQRKPSQLSLAVALENAFRIITCLGPQMRKQAGGFADEAIKLYRGTDPRSPNLAEMLQMYADWCMEIKDFEVGLRRAREAADIYAHLASGRLAEYGSNSAASWAAVYTFLDALGRHEEALAAAKSAIRIRRDLCKGREEHSQALLAQSLTRAFHSCRKLKRNEESLSFVDDSSRIYRSLVDSHSKDYTHPLAISLLNMSSCLGNLGSHKASLERASEAAHLFKQLTEQRQDPAKTAQAHEHLVLALITLSRCHYDLQEGQAALRTAVQAIQVCNSALQGVGDKEELLTKARQQHDVADKLCRSASSRLLDK